MIWLNFKQDMIMEIVEYCEFPANGKITNFKNSIVVNYLFANNHFILSDIYIQKGKIVGFYKRKK